MLGALCYVCMFCAGLDSSELKILWGDDDKMMAFVETHVMLLCIIIIKCCCCIGEIAHSSPLILVFLL